MEPNLSLCHSHRSRPSQLGGGGHDENGHLAQGLLLQGCRLGPHRASFAAHPARDGSLYRLRVKAGAKREKGLGTPLLTIHVFRKLLAEVEITASADKPQWYEFVFAEKDLTDVQIHRTTIGLRKIPSRTSSSTTATRTKVKRRAEIGRFRKRSSYPRYLSTRSSLRPITPLPGRRSITSGCCSIRRIAMSRRNTPPRF